MNYYLTPEGIAEGLNLTETRKCTRGGYYLLSEYDLLPYGIAKAVEEGAIELASGRQMPDISPGVPTTTETTEKSENSEHSENSENSEDSEEETETETEDTNANTEEA